MIEQNIQIFNEDEVRRFFPKNTHALFEKPEEQIYFFGFRDEGKDIEDNKLKGKYLILKLFVLDKKPSVFFSDSKSHWIREEHSKFNEIQSRYGLEHHLYNTHPLLTITLCSHYTNPDVDFGFMNLIRYADHEKYRKNWLGKKTLDAISEELKSKGVKYLYLDNRVKGWNDKFNERLGLVERHNLPMQDLIELASYFPDETVESLGRYSNYSHLIKKL